MGRSELRTLCGRVFAPRSFKGSLKRRLSPLLRASLMAIGVSEVGAGLMEAMMALALSSDRLTMTTGRRRLAV